jgi:N-acetylmuramoyl-L-alanine amidase
MKSRWCALVGFLAGTGITGCAHRAVTVPPRPTPGEQAALALRVVYPRLTPDSAGNLRGRFDSRDSAFVFGSVTRPDATVTVNGQHVTVAPTGAWLAWLGLPSDSVARFEVRASDSTASDSVLFATALPSRYVPPDSAVWIDTTALSPIGVIWARPGEGVVLRARAAPGSVLSLRLGDSTLVAFVPDSAPPEPPWGERAFGVVAPARRRAAPDRQLAWVVGPVGPDPGPVLHVAHARAAGSDLELQAVIGPDTARVRWPLQIGVLDPEHPTVAEVNDDTAGTGTTDGILAGRPAPSGTYHWFFPNGTRAVVSGRRNDQVRLQLSQRTVAWVDAADVQPLPAGTPPISGTTQAFRLAAGDGFVTLRVPVPGRVPFRVDEDGRRLSLTLYGVAANADWVQYGPADPLVHLIRFEAPAEDETRVVVDLTVPVWGYRTRWSGNDLLLDIRRPPSIDPRHPLLGRLIALDAGHPPAGTTGPTGTYEADVTLAVVRAALPLFEKEGARVLLVRQDTAPLGLFERVKAAEEADADLLISVHANALPDGVNPFVNAGTSVYYFHPQAVDFARAVDTALVRVFGFRDLGIGRGDLALARPTWMPSILTEGLFLMLPDQEAVLISAEGQQRYAAALVAGARAFLQRRARPE